MARYSQSGPPFTDELKRREVSDQLGYAIWDTLDRIGFGGEEIPGLFGSGIDGDETVVGTSTPTEDKYYNNLTVPAGTTLDLSAGVKVYVKGRLTINGTIQSIGLAGSDAVANVGGAAPSPAQTGATGAAGAGTQAVAVTTVANTVGGDGGASGASGAGDGGAGAAGLPTVVSDNRGDWNGPYSQVSVAGGTGQAGQGGSAGAGDGGANLGGGGGGGGGVGKPIILFVNEIALGPLGAITLEGGAGGNGGDALAGNSGGGSGAGGGGSGGFYAVINKFAPGAPPTIFPNRTGGAGGLGGVATGTGVAGAPGAQGGAGKGYAQILSINQFLVF